MNDRLLVLPSCSISRKYEKMGGDDLGSDDEFLISHIKEDSPTEPNEEVEEAVATKTRKKRKLSDDIQESKSASSRTKKKSPAKLMLEAGRHLEEQSVEQQASFLSIALRHHSLLASSEEGDELLPQYFASSRKESLVERLKDALSLKKIKKWNHTGSPAVVIFSISARRAVAILKELAPLKVRTAKLFPKNGDIKTQCEQLRSTSFGLAVGTPHRLEMLCQEDDGLNFEHTRLVVLDCHVTNKAFTVCTSKDTAPHCTALLKQHVLPQLKKRDNVRLAFF